MQRDAPVQRATYVPLSPLGPLSNVATRGSTGEGPTMETTALDATTPLDMRNPIFRSLVISFWGSHRVVAAGSSVSWAGLALQCGSAEVCPSCWHAVI